jgi:hypothetical protein
LLPEHKNENKADGKKIIYQKNKNRGKIFEKALT